MLTGTCRIRKRSRLRVLRTDRIRDRLRRVTPAQCRVPGARTPRRVPSGCLSPGLPVITSRSARLSVLNRRPVRRRMCGADPRLCGLDDVRHPRLARRSPRSDGRAPLRVTRQQAGLRPVEVLAPIVYPAYPPTFAHGSGDAHRPSTLLRTALSRVEGP